jgi:hypothetical protein
MTGEGIRTIERAFAQLAARGAARPRPPRRVLGVVEGLDLALDGVLSARGTGVGEQSLRGVFGLISTALGHLRSGVRDPMG